MHASPVFPWQSLRISNAKHLCQRDLTDRVPLHGLPRVPRARPVNGGVNACTKRLQRTPRPAYSHLGSGTTRSFAQPTRITDDQVVKPAVRAGWLGKLEFAGSVFL